MRLSLFAAMVFFATGLATASAQDKATLELSSDRLLDGRRLPESPKGVYGIRLTAQVDKKGEGKGVLEIDPNAPLFDEFGFATIRADLPWVKLECELKFVKKKTFRIPGGRIGALDMDVEWLLFEIQGPKIASRLFLATEEKTARQWARLLIRDKEDKVEYLGNVAAPAPPIPCHPGCFPAGTPIRVPGGSQPIDRLREGDIVTIIGPDGSAATRKVASVFVTKNRTFDVRTDNGNLVTTETQPVALVDGRLRAVGELKAGDRIYRWDGRERLIVTVKSVSPTGREEPVFNLVLGEPAVFVANGFLVRSKPPLAGASVGAAEHSHALPSAPRKE